MNYNSIVNQDIKGKLIAREVYTNVNSMAEYILRQSYEDSTAPFSYEDITNFYSYPEYNGSAALFAGGAEEARDAEIKRLREIIESFEDGEQGDSADTIKIMTDDINNDIEALENLESQPAEIYEWWAVSSWLCDKLKAHGQCVIEGHNLWGRCTTGQAILLDHVIGVIAEEMEILEGQPNSWENMKG